MHSEPSVLYELSGALWDRAYTHPVWITSVSTEPPRESQITLREEDGGWVGTHVETGVASQGETPQEALEMVLEAVELRRGETGQEVSSAEEERQVLEELGLDPEEIEAARADDEDLPKFMHKCGPN